MNFKEFVKEADVDNTLAQRRMMKQAERGMVKKREKFHQEQSAKAEMFKQIDHAVAATIDFLVNEKGMDDEEAERMVYSHLSDLAMANDLM